MIKKYTSCHKGIYKSLIVDKEKKNFKLTNTNLNGVRTGKINLVKMMLQLQNKGYSQTIVTLHESNGNKKIIWR